MYAEFLGLPSGSIELDGVDLKRQAPHQRIDAGVSRTFQNIRLFDDLTVWQNLWVAWRDAPGQEHSWFSNWFGRSLNRRHEIQKLLEFSGLGDKSNNLAGNLAFGEQRRLETGACNGVKTKIDLA